MLKRLFSFLVLLMFACTLFAADAKIEEELSGFDDVSVEELEGFSDGTDEDLAGFLEQNVSQSENEAEPERAKAFVLGGNIAFKSAVGYHDHEVDGVDYGGFNQAQTSVYLQLDGKLSDDWRVRISGDAFYDAIYDLRSDQDYSQEVLDDYRTQLRLDDTYVQGRLTPELDLKAGRQVVVWGKSDNIRITDVINPMDNRLPGMTDIEDLRLSVGMLKLDYYTGVWNFSAMIIPENRIMMEATPRGKFFPVDDVFYVPGGVPDPFPALVTPAFSWDDMQYAFAANAVFRGWDLSFYAADVLDQKWHFIEPPRPNTPLSDRTVSKVKMLGSAVNISEGSWLFKAETAFLDGVKYNNTPDEKQRIDALIGFEYMGFNDTTLSFELANRHIFEYESRMKTEADFVDRNEMQTALRATRSFSNETLDLTALVSMFGEQWENGGFVRVWLEYELMEAVNVQIGIVDYIGGQKPYLESIKDNDRIFADIQYSF